MEFNLVPHIIFEDITSFLPRNEAEKFLLISRHWYHKLNIDKFPLRSLIAQFTKHDYIYEKYSYLQIEDLNSKSFIRLCIRSDKEIKFNNGSVFWRKYFCKVSLAETIKILEDIFKNCVFDKISIFYNDDVLKIFAILRMLNICNSKVPILNFEISITQGFNQSNINPRIHLDIISRLI